MGSVLSWIAPCNLCVLCDSVVSNAAKDSITEAPRTQRSHRESENLDSKRSGVWRVRGEPGLQLTGRLAERVGQHGRLKEFL